MEVPREDEFAPASYLKGEWAGEKGRIISLLLNYFLVPLRCSVTYPTVEICAVKCSSISHSLSREAGLDIKGPFQISNADLGPDSGMRVEVEEQ